MLKEIIEHINCNLKPLNIANNIYGLCETIKGGTIEYPAYESLNGEYKKVEFELGAIYHRIKSDYSENENDDASVDGCGIMVERSYPMVCICVIDKKKDVGYSDEVLAGIISKNILIKNNRQLRQSLNLDSINVFVSSVSINRNDIQSKEFKGIGDFVGFEHSLIAISYNIEIIAEVACLQNC